jgi:hypothetical protein
MMLISPVQDTDASEAGSGYFSRFMSRKGFFAQ